MTASAPVHSESSHVDSFTLDHLPPPDSWPRMLCERTEFQFSPHLNCAGELLDSVLEKRRHHSAILAPGGFEWDYDELGATVSRISHVLTQDLGMVPGNRVLLRGHNTPALAAIWLAVVKAGGVVVPTMPLLRAKELRYIIDKAQVTHVLCEQRLDAELHRALLDSAAALAVMRYESPWGGELAGAALGKPSDFAAVESFRDDPCLIAFTSGTTGPAKATVHTHRDIMAICNGFPKSVLRATGDDRFIGSPPLAFTFGLGGLLLFPLAVGATTILLDRAGPTELARAIAEYGATVCFTAPTAYRSIANDVAKPFPALRICVSAGEALSTATRELWSRRTGLNLIDGLGSTELLHIFISHPAGSATPADGAIGTAVPGYRIAILDESARPAPTGVVGRLAVQGPTGCRYLDDEQRQRAYVINGWNVTGDAGWIDDAGCYHHVGRHDDMIVSAGYNISPVEVEQGLTSHPAVAECAVVGVPDPGRGQIVAAFVVLARGWIASSELAQDIQVFAKTEMAPYKYPRRIEFVDELPRNHSGKLQRFALCESRDGRVDEQ